MLKARAVTILNVAFATIAMLGCAKTTPESTTAENVALIKATCPLLGKKARQEWITKYDKETFSDDPEYGYSSALNTCLYADEYSDVNPGSRQPLLTGIASRRDRFVLDVYSGKVVLEYTEHDGKSIQTEPGSVMCRSEAEFEARKAKLFADASR